MSITRVFLSTCALALAMSAEANAASAPVTLDATLSQSVLPAGQRQNVFLRIGIKSAHVPRTRERAPLNVALVIDRSGSMSGRKMEEARKAALMALDRLGNRDVISVVSYDDRVEVEVPATRATNSRHMPRRIESLSARGSTAIHAGLLAGAEELRKFKSRDFVNRIILLSDGLANVGPSHPSAFEALGHEFASEGIIVSTVGLGLGYNEDLMAKLARASDGNHAFVQEPEDLAQFFSREFDDAQSVIAQDIEIIIECAPGVTPRKSLGRSARIEGNRIVYKLGQLIGGTEQTLLVELEAPALEKPDPSQLAKVALSYRKADDGSQGNIEATVEARASASVDEVKASHEKDVLRDATLLEARARKDEAIALRDRGQFERAKQVFEQNISDIKARTASYGFAPSPELSAEQEANEKAAKLDDRDTSAWGQQRKAMRQQNTNAAGASKRF